MQICMKATPEALETIKQDLMSARKSSVRTLDEIGVLADVHPSQVSRICNGQFKTITQNVVQVCKVLGVTVPGVTVASARTDDRPVIPWPRLEESLNRLWDRTPEGMERIAALLETVASLRER